MTDGISRWKKNKKKAGSIVAAARLDLSRDSLQSITSGGSYSEYNNNNGDNNSTNNNNNDYDDGSTTNTGGGGGSVGGGGSSAGGAGASSTSAISTAAGDIQERSKSTTTDATTTTETSSSTKQRQTQVEIQAGAGEPNHDSWKKKYDPSWVVKKVEPSVPPHSWEHYVAEPSVKRALQRIGNAAAQCRSEGSVQANVLAAIRKITRGTTKGGDSNGANGNGPNANNAHKVVLFHGPPGCGKTHAVQVMSSEVSPSNVSVYHVDLNSIKSSWVGQTEHQLKHTLEHIGKMRNAIVFMDEIDSFVGEFNRQDRYNAPLLTMVLQWIDGIDTKGDEQNLTIITATNCMKTCDPAFLSRCVIKIEIPPPSQMLRLEWWKSRARHLKCMELEELACYPVDSFRCLEQLVTDLEEESAETTGYAPCFTEYRTRLRKVSDDDGGGGSTTVGNQGNNNRGRIKNNQHRSSGGGGGMGRNHGASSANHHHYDDNNTVNSSQMLNMMEQRLLEQVHALAASTAASTVAAMTAAGVVGVGPPMRNGMSSSGQHKLSMHGTNNVPVPCAIVPMVSVGMTEETIGSTCDDDGSSRCVEEEDEDDEDEEGNEVVVGGDNDDDDVVTSETAMEQSNNNTTSESYADHHHNNMESLQEIESRLAKLECAMSNNLKSTAMETAIDALRADLTKIQTNHKQRLDVVNAQRDVIEADKRLLKKHIESLKREVREYQEWDLLHVYWKIEGFDSRMDARGGGINSRTVTLAGRQIRLNLEVARFGPRLAGSGGGGGSSSTSDVMNTSDHSNDNDSSSSHTNDERRRPVGLFMYYVGGDDSTPAYVGGSTITIFHPDKPDDVITNTFGDTDRVELHSGLGKRKMTTLGVLRDTYVDYSTDKEGVLRVKANIRVARMSSNLYPRFDIS